MNDLINLCYTTVFENFTFFLCKLYLLEASSRCCWTIYIMQSIAECVIRNRYTKLSAPTQERNTKNITYNCFASDKEGKNHGTKPSFPLSRWLRITVVEFYARLSSRKHYWCQVNKRKRQGVIFKQKSKNSQ